MVSSFAFVLRGEGTVLSERGPDRFNLAVGVVALDVNFKLVTSEGYWRFGKTIDKREKKEKV